MPANRYLSIGEVLGLLLEDFPDVTISKIRFLESQGLIEPERTPSGYRKFYDHDVDLLRAILHEQRENFLPLKVIRDRIESGGIQADGGGARTPPRGIRNVDTVAKATAGGAAAAGPGADGSSNGGRDSVFRRTDGGPEWADGRALIPGEAPSGVPSPVTAAVPVTPATPQAPHLPGLESAAPGADVAPVSSPEIVAALIELPAEAESEAVVASVVSSVVAAVVDRQVAEPPVPVVPIAAAPTSPGPSGSPGSPGSLGSPTSPGPSGSRTTATETGGERGLPYDRDELCAAAGITLDQLGELESFGLVVGRGAGRDVTYAAQAVAIATVAARFLANGIDARHLRTWRQAADREAALFEQRIMPLLRQRNPQARQSALDTLTELAGLGGQLRTALLDSILRHHFEGG